MRIIGDKLQCMRQYYETAVSAASLAQEDFRKFRAQYRGDPTIDGSNEKAAFCRNVTYEIIESMISTVIPSARVDAAVFTEKNQELAESVGRLCMKLRNRLAFERINDITERDTTVTGASVYLLEWDDSARKRGVDGEVCISAVDPMDFFPQPNRSSVQDMDYCFIRSKTTVRDIEERYGIGAEQLGGISVPADMLSGDGLTVEVITCFYYDDNGKLSKFVFSGDAVLEDIPNYYSRKAVICQNCGKSQGNCTCGRFSPVLADIECEEVRRELLPQDVYIKEGAESVSVPWYEPKSMPVVVRTNITRADRWYGESDCEFIRPFQQELNKIESRIHAKLLGASVIPVLPAESEFRMDNSLNSKVLRLREGEDKGRYGVIDTSVDISQDMENAERVYQMAKRSMGITDSFQGHADDTALSGRAKQIQVDQSAGRMASKRIMKQAAFAEMDRIIFEYYLAYADEPRETSYVDAMGRRKNDRFDRYAFIRYDEKSGEYYYFDDLLFAVDSSNELESEQTRLADRLIAQFSQGVLGEPSSPAAALRLWQCLDKLHHPLGRFNSDYFLDIVNRLGERAYVGNAQTEDTAQKA